MAKIKMTGLADEIIRCLNEYTDEVVEALEETKVNLAKEGTKRIKQRSPKRTGKYAKSWSYKKYSGKTIIYNRKHYQLTHLLEKGHRKRGGKGNVAAIPHIAKVEREMQRIAAREFEKTLNRR